MKVAALYVRQSVFKEDSLSINDQIEKCKSRLDGNEKYKVYDDSDFSGKDTERPNFKKMEDGVKNGEISKVIIYKLDRLTRSTRDFIDIFDLLKNNNVDLISVSEAIDTSTELGRAMAIILVTFGEMERLNTVKRVSDNYGARARVGGYLGGPAPFGFSIAKMPNPFNQKEIKYLIENDNMSYVRKIFNKYLAGDSLTKIAAYLNRNKVITPNFDRDTTKIKPRKNASEKKPAWDSGKVSRLLRNVNYAKASPAIYNYFITKGASVYNDIEQFKDTDRGLQLVGRRLAKDRKYTKVNDHTLYIMAHKGAIESDDWLAVQYKLDNNKQIKNMGKGQYSWLSGLVKCGKCGSSLIVKYSLTRQGEKKYFYLACSGRMNAGTSYCEGFDPPLLLEDVETHIDSEFLSYLKNFNDIKPKFDVPAEIRNKQAELDANRAKIKNIVLVLENDGHQYSEFRDRFVFLKREEERLRAELDGLSQQNANSHQQNIENIIEDWHSLTADKKREIAKEALNKIAITEDEEGAIVISVDYKIGRLEEERM